MTTSTPTPCARHRGGIKSKSALNIKLPPRPQSPPPRSPPAAPHTVAGNPQRERSPDRSPSPELSPPGRERSPSGGSFRKRSPSSRSRQNSFRRRSSSKLGDDDDSSPEATYRRRRDEQLDAFSRRVASMPRWGDDDDDRPPSPLRSPSLRRQRTLTLLRGKPVIGEAQKQELLESFQMMDMDDSGAIDADELHDAMQLIGIKSEKEELLDLINSVDVNSVLLVFSLLWALLSLEEAAAESRSTVAPRRFAFSCVPALPGTSPGSCRRRTSTPS